MNKLTIKLYITGRTVRSDTALENLYTVLNEYCSDEFDLSVIDVLENPQVAEDELILATPTLVKLNPLPARMIIGDLSNAKLLLDNLDIANSLQS